MLQLNVRQRASVSVFSHMRTRYTAVLQIAISNDISTHAYIRVDGYHG